MLSQMHIYTQTKKHTRIQPFIHTHIHDYKLIDTYTNKQSYLQKHIQININTQKQIVIYRHKKEDRYKPTKRTYTNLHNYTNRYILTNTNTIIHKIHIQNILIYTYIQDKIDIYT